ncbi:MAG: FAD-dependent oxidoreductase [Muribaculaceae bacterium]|jgi:probable pyridine nucleotide-disulfide oxidoreductase|nr:FAD-dependent oxidoreductase [Muribaculaceae bacterium]
MKTFDAIIIGFGKGGKTLAADFAKRGKTVAVIEKSNMMYGGTCINIGCIPTKTLVHQAKLASLRSDASFEAKKAFYSQSIEVKDSVTSLLRQKNYHNLADNPNITVFDGVGSFVSENVVSVASADKSFELQSNMIFINTGAETVIPPIKGVAENPNVFTSTSILNLKELPKRLVIIGGGYIGLEFASMYSSFGSSVTVLESFPMLIGREDRDIAEAVKSALENKGIKFILSAKVTSVSESSSASQVNYDDASGNPHSLDAEAVLLATGRRPAISNLNLAAAGVEVDARGAIIVDEHLVTTNPHVRALGDVKGGLQFTYISLDDYRIVREDLFGNGNRVLNDRNPVSYSVFIDPPLSRIGIGEDEAVSKGMDVVVKRLPVMAVPRAKTLGETVGLMKAIIDNRTNKILGCTLFSPDSSEVINTVAAVMKADLDYTFLRDFIFTHPSMSEALNDLFS